MKQIAILIIKIYRLFISPLKPPTCRFVPTCSEYALQAIEKHGIIRGGIWQYVVFYVVIHFILVAMILFNI